nr:hypothetical protein [Allomuricauda sp.]
MKNFTIKVSTLSLLLLSCFSGFTQNNKASEPEFPKKCYLFDSYGDVRSMTKVENMFLLKEEREADEHDMVRIDTVMIEKRLGDHDFIISRQGRKGYAVLHREIIVADSVIGINTPFEGETIEEVETQFNDNDIPDHARLQMRYAFSLSKKEQMDKAPGLNEISREDLIQSFKWREAIGGMLKTLLEENPDMPRYRFMRFVEEYRNQKLIELGYNPYKQVVYNWEKQFGGDSEVIELLTQPVTFE